MIINLERLEARVNCGARLLDDIRPEWFNDINIEHLDIASPNQCICGQVFCEEVESFLQNCEDRENWEDDGMTNGYDYAESILHIDPIQNGFCWPTDISPVLSALSKDGAKIWELLAILWVEKIEKRRAEAGTML